MTGKEDQTVMMGVGGGGAAMGGVLKPPKAKLICLDDSLLDPSQKGLVIFLDEKEVTLGRGEENTHPIKYGKISRVHARIFPSEGKWGVEDLKSTNGVWINDVRVTMEPLKPGDYLRIGAVPFRFVLERPEAAALGGAAASAGGVAGGDAEHTMMFGSMSDSRAAEALMVANVDAEPVRARPIPAAAANAPSPSGGNVHASKSKTPMLAVIGVVALLVAGGAGYFLIGGPGGEEETNALRKQIKDFSYTYEEPSGSPSRSDLQNALTEVARIRGEIQDASNKFPKNTQLRGLIAKALFLEMERNFYKAMKEDRSDQLLPLVEQLEGQINALKPPADQPMPEEIPQTLEVLTMARNIAQIKRFQQRFPDPSENAAAKPTPQEFSTYQDARDQFVSKKRNPKVNSMLSVSYAFFGRMASEVDQSVLPLLDKWKEHAR